MKKGFTLIELLIVIGIIAILAAALIVGLSPAERFAQTRDSVRESHINTLYNSLTSYYVSYQGNWNDIDLPTYQGEEEDLKEICNTNDYSSNDCQTEDLVDLSPLTEEGHLTQIPIDPQGGINNYGTGYFIAQSSVVLLAERAETRYISIGMIEVEEEPQEEYTLSWTIDGEGSIYIDGTWHNSSDSEVFDGGSIVDINADPDEGWEWMEWTGDTVNITDPGSASTQITMEGDYTITANFEEEEGEEFSCAQEGQGEHTVNGHTVFCDSDDTIWSPTLDLPADENSDQEYEWGCYGDEVGAYSDTNGEYNTNQILDGCSETPIAAEQCDNLTYAGYDDWYLPALNTLGTLYDDCDEDEVRCDDWDDNAQSLSYWSSTELSSDHALILFFDNGSTSTASKSLSRRVRCVRR